MSLFRQRWKLDAIHGSIRIDRNSHGVPHIRAANREDLYFGLGHMHARDRMVQLMTYRAVARGRASEYFAGTTDLIELDKHMRWLHLNKDATEEMEKLQPEIRSIMQAYCGGINAYIENHRRRLEFLLTGYTPEPWTPEDSLVTARATSYIGLAQAQGDAEKFIIQLIRAGISKEKIRELFPGIQEEIDAELIQSITLERPTVPSHLWSGLLPRFSGSNNWVVSGEMTKSGAPVMASDPHMEINRLPPLWYEMVGELAESSIIGITLPGLPVVIFGRNDHLAWSNTYGFVDMIDYFVEECRDGQYRYDGEWRQFEKREERLDPKGKKPIDLTFYENEHGVLEGDPTEPGRYLCMAFAGRTGTGADIFNVMLSVDEIRTVREAQRRFRKIPIPPFNWLFADGDGDIGYQMSGCVPKRPDGVSGLLPVPGWDPTYDWQGYEDPEHLPSCYNPEAGYIATANNNLNDMGEADPINLAMAPYRVDRINELLQEQDRYGFTDFKRMQYDVYSRQAERLMQVIQPLLPDDHPNARLLSEWDRLYLKDSMGATVFESVYRELIATVFGEYGIGEDAVRHLMDETSVFANFFGYFDDILCNEGAEWFDGVNRTTVLGEAVERGIDVKPKPYGKTRKFDVENVFFGGRLPGFLGFDMNNRSLPGSRATIPQMQIVTMLNREVAVGPSYRMIVEIDRPGIWSNLPGGPSDNRFSRWYKSDFDNWERGFYKRLEVGTEDSRR